MFLAIGLIVLILCSCSKGSGKEEKNDEMQESNKQEENYLEIDDISWGMTVNETLKAYAVDKTDVEELTESTYATSFYIRDGREVFGTKTESILFISWMQHLAEKSKSYVVLILFTRMMLL